VGILGNDENENERMKSASSSLDGQFLWSCKQNHTNYKLLNQTFIILFSLQLTLIININFKVNFSQMPPFPCHFSTSFSFTYLIIPTKLLHILFYRDPYLVNTRQIYYIYIYIYIYYLLNWFCKIELI